MRTRDLQGFSEGSHRRLWEVLGAHVTDEGVRFAVWAPNAIEVRVVGDWNAGAEADALRLNTAGVWTGVSAGARVGHRYQFRITTADGELCLKADPMARAAELAPSNRSVILGESQHRWVDEAWMSTRSRARGTPLRIYEVHLGSWRKGATTYRELGAQLAEYVSDLGFTHVELLPIAEYPFGGSWGYQVTGYYAPTARYGSPDDFRAMIDELHRCGVGVIIDWVAAHFPRDEWALARFDGTPLYEYDDPQRGEHPDWGTYIFDFGRAEVRNFLIANALYWLHEFHIDGLRVDAVTSMLRLDFSRADGQWTPNDEGGYENLEAVAFVRELNAVVSEEVPTALMIAEESTAWPKVTHATDEGGLGFSHKWNLGWMNDTLKYMQRGTARRPLHHNELTFGLTYAFHERFVLPLSHDEVVHLKRSLWCKMPGDEAARFANLRALYAWMWALPGAPLLFMGAELAQLTEWNYADELPWHLQSDPRRRGVRDLLVELNRLVVEWPALYERDHDPASFQWLDPDDAGGSTYAFLRWGNDSASAVGCAANFSGRARAEYRVGVPWVGKWQLLLDSNVGAVGEVVPATEQAWQGQPCSLVVAVPPLSVVWVGSKRPS